MNRRVVSVVVGFAVGVGVLAGCTAPAVEPSPSPSVSVTPSPSVSPTPTLTAEEQLLAQIPEGAKGDDLLAAVEMAKFFVTLHPGLYQGKDPALFEFLSLPECDFCSSSLEVTRERLAEGTVQVGGDFTVPEQVVESVFDTETDNTTTALVGFKVTEAPWDFVDSTGTVTKSKGEGSFEAAVALRHIDGLWRVYEVSLA
jgi:hypothetical protein